MLKSILQLTKMSNLLFSTQSSTFLKHLLKKFKDYSHPYNPQPKCFLNYYSKLKKIFKMKKIGTLNPKLLSESLKHSKSLKHLTQKIKKPYNFVKWTLKPPNTFYPKPHNHSISTAALEESITKNYNLTNSSPGILSLLTRSQKFYLKLKAPIIKKLYNNY